MRGRERSTTTTIVVVGAPPATAARLRSMLEAADDLRSVRELASAPGTSRNPGR